MNPASSLLVNILSVSLWKNLTAKLPILSQFTPRPVDGKTHIGIPTFFADLLYNREVGVQLINKMYSNPIKSLALPKTKLRSASPWQL